MELPTPKYLQREYLIRNYYDLSKPPSDIFQSIDNLKILFEDYLSKSFNQQVRLDVFGSLLSGFGSRDSDIDVCLRFESEEQPEDVNVPNLIRTMAKYLRHSDMVTKVEAIPLARVPILKVEIGSPMEISMDISYENTLALENTKLLAAYCRWEPERLPQLGLWVKKWAKAGGICNSNGGYFSSYACILLLIHYLQNCKPAVLPRLQEDFEQREIIHSSGWNTYFYTEVKPNWSRNTQSVGELFLGFLEYYKEFDVKTKVVQIRRTELMTKNEKKAEKNWNCKLYTWAIEDPFELDRNVSHGLGPRKCRRIKEYIVKSVDKFRSTNFEAIPGYRDDFYAVLDIFFKSCYVEEEDNKKKKKKNKGKKSKVLGEEGYDSVDDEEDSDGVTTFAEIVETKPEIGRSTNSKRKFKVVGSQAAPETEALKRAVEQMDSLLNALFLEKQNFPTLTAPDEPFLLQDSVEDRQSPLGCSPSKSCGEVLRSVKKIRKKPTNAVPNASLPPQQAQRSNAWKLNNADFPLMTPSQSSPPNKPSPWNKALKQSQGSIWSNPKSDFPSLLSSVEQISAPQALVPPRTPWASSTEDFPPITSPKSASETPSNGLKQSWAQKTTPDRNAWGSPVWQTPPPPSDVAASCPFKIS